MRTIRPDCRAMHSKVCSLALLSACAGLCCTSHSRPMLAVLLLRYAVSRAHLNQTSNVH